MRQMLLILALVGAIVSGWLPAMAATLDVARPDAMHAMHQTVADESGSEHDEHGKTKPAAHPLACSACYAIEADQPDARSRMISISSDISAAMPQLAGMDLCPLDPPPRS